MTRLRATCAFLAGGAGVDQEEVGGMSEFKLALWHHAYSRWFDHFEDGHHRRAWIWARITDGMSWAFWGVR